MSQRISRRWIKSVGLRAVSKLLEIGDPVVVSFTTRSTVITSIMDIIITSIISVIILKLSTNDNVSAPLAHHGGLA
jgi:hypothetical protein